MPKPKKVDGRVIWDRIKLEAAFADLPGDDEENIVDFLSQGNHRRNRSFAMTDTYPSLSSYTDRHGKLRWRYRTKERMVSLPAPDQPGFEEAYQAAVEGRKINKAPVVKMPGAALPGTFGAAFQRLRISVKWLALDEAHFFGCKSMVYETVGKSSQQNVNQK